jgi:hypothetical protein
MKTIIWTEEDGKLDVFLKALILLGNDIVQVVSTGFRPSLGVNTLVSACIIYKKHED